MSNKKICIFLPSIGYGGAEINLKRIGELLAKKGYKIVFVIAKTVRVEQTINYQENVDYIFLNSKKTFLSFNKLRKTINHVKPNVVLSTLPTSNLMVVLLKYLKLINCKVVVREANSNFLNWKGSIKNKIKKKLALFTFNNSDGNIFISYELRDNVISNIKNKNHIVIYNPVFTEDFYKKANQEILDLDLNDKEIWVTTSRLEHQKGLDILFNAAYKFINVKNFILLIVGGGSLEDKYKKKYSDLPLKFIGNVDNPLKYLKLADIFFFPSRREGLGNSLIEAQILGKNIISSDCPSGPKEIIKLFENGVLFESENEDELVKTINNFKIKDHNNTSPQIISKFSVTSVGDQYLEFLLENSD